MSSGHKVNIISLSDVQANEHFELYVARDEASLAGLPDDYIKKSAYYNYKFIQVNGGCFRKVQDGVSGPIQVSMYGRIYLQTNYYDADGRLLYTDPALVSMYKSLARYAISHCCSKFKDNRGGMTIYVMPSARTLLQDDIDHGRITLESNRFLYHMITRDTEIINDKRPKGAGKCSY